MKGCKGPQRPKKRAKIIQRSLLLVSPGAWLTDMCQERYEVREKKSSKKRPRGLKVMEQQGHFAFENFGNLYCDVSAWV
ncbi:hypothetical protein Patl1_15786 [Pistacia atlantica]|uniref:Uncharacterized protein n=1 Tax=Pistacia atlantica TaxID=434234 RepID=A0ACC1B702_9ROSI|nr:hypothetical protein Patl1_15786 [Pistacia atlantica]